MIKVFLGILITLMICIQPRVMAQVTLKLQPTDCRFCHFEIAQKLEKDVHFKDYIGLTDQFKGDLSCIGCHLGTLKGKSAFFDQQRFEPLRSTLKKNEKKRNFIENMLKSQPKAIELRDACDSCHGLGKLVFQSKQTQSLEPLHVGLKTLKPRVCQSCHIDMHFKLLPFSYTQSVDLIKHKD